jgi:hypothetical protein
MPAAATAKPRRTKRAAVEVEGVVPLDVDDAAPLVDDEPAELDVDEGALSGVVVPPALTFTTPKKQRTQDDVTERSIAFTIDGEVYTIVRPRKLTEALAGLIEVSARRATQGDVLFAGSNFLRRVLAPESLTRIQARLDDDDDDFAIGDLFDNLEAIALELIRLEPSGAASGPVPARRRAVNR